jgi:hypothetical protein
MHGTLKKFQRGEDFLRFNKRSRLALSTFVQNRRFMQNRGWAAERLLCRSLGFGTSVLYKRGFLCKAGFHLLICQNSLDLTSFGTNFGG